MSPLQRVLFTLLSAVFCVTLGVGLIAPLLPLYAQSLGAGGFFIGLIFGSFSVTRSIFLPVFGGLSDRHGRKPFLMGGLAVYCVVAALFAQADGVWDLVLLRLCQGFGSAMIIPVAQAYLADVTPDAREGKMMGLLNMALFGGLAAGPLVGGVVNDMVNIQASFYTMSGLSCLSLTLCAFGLPREDRDLLRKSRERKSTSFQLLKNPVVLCLCVYRFSFTICLGIIWAFLPLWAGARADLSSSAIGVLVSLNVGLPVLLSTPMGAMADRRSKKIMMIGGGALSVVSLLCFAGARTFTGFLAANALFGVAAGISSPALMAVAVIAGRGTGSMGALMGLLAMAHSAGMFCGPIVSGFFMDWVSSERVFEAAAVVAALGTLTLYRYGKWEEAKDG
jgi:DHA1 family multidrug resistance protein-like MFS transporter